MGDSVQIVSRQVWKILWVAFICAVVFCAVGWIYLYKDDSRFVNYAVALIPVLFSIFFGFIPDVRERHMGWRVGIIGIGIIWSALLWRQQVIADIEQGKAIAGAVNTAVDRSEKHSDQQNDSVKKKIDGVRDDLGSTNRTLDRLSNLVQQSESDLSDSISKVKMAPPATPHLVFSLFEDTMDKIPTTRAYVRALEEGNFLVDVTVYNDSDYPVHKADLWVFLCQLCSFTSEPSGFDKPNGSSDSSRHKMLDLLNPGVTFEKMTLPITFNSKLASFNIGLKYTCETCGKVSKEQTIRVFTLPPFTIAPQKKKGPLDFGTTRK